MSFVPSIEDIEAGAMVADILRSRIWADHAPSAHSQVIDALRSSGFHARPEYPTRNLGDRRDGRIDIVARYGGGGIVGIELDCRKPRRRSILKLNLFAGYRIIGIRGIEGHDPPPGIDACVTMRVRVASPLEKADRRIYRPAPEWASDWKGVA